MRSSRFSELASLRMRRICSSRRIAGARSGTGWDGRPGSRAPGCTLPCTHYWRRALCRVPVALGKGSFALGKAFAECNTRQRASVESPSGKGCFAECQISGTRQRLYRVLKKHSVKKNTRQNSNRKKPKKNSKFFFLIGGRPPPTSAVFFFNLLQVAAFFTCYAAGGIRTRNLSLVRNPLYHCTTPSFVSIFRFGSYNIIQNRV